MERGTLVKIQLIASATFREELLAILHLRWRGEGKDAACEAEWRDEEGIGYSPILKWNFPRLFLSIVPD
jgi:hypothetical protein